MDVIGQKRFKEVWNILATLKLRAPKARGDDGGCTEAQLCACNVL
jgi:hypothetical protein